MVSDGDPLRFDHEVTNAADLIAVVNALRENLEAQPEGWQNVTLGSYLESIEAWLSTFPQAYINLDSQTPEPDWRFVADVLRAGRIYE